MNSERLYTLIDQPHISEKVSTIGDDSNQFAFKVDRSATKREIKEAVEKLFEVEVLSVNTINVKGKVKRNFRGTVSRARNWKKAYVRLEQGQEIDFATVE